ncbi:MAG: hypothetical protein LBK73_08145 [Treponema sp.]|jgi:hypothetical protein|nr:hypothetical protein [Treponema sp.]
MALSAISMKNDIINALKSGADTAANANKKFGDAVLKNICDNMQITYQWKAANSSGTTDPTGSFNATVSGNGTLTPDTFELMLVKLATLIKGLTIQAATGFTVAPLTFNPAGVLDAVMAKEKDQDAAMTNLCAQIIASVKTSFVNPAPVSGGHAAFAGSTTAMVIS